MSGPLFGLVPAGLPVQTEPASAPSPTSFLYRIPAARPFSHIVVFLLPGVVLPPDTAAAIYLATPARGPAPDDFQFLGGIGPGKESAVFKLNVGTTGTGTSTGTGTGPAAAAAAAAAAAPVPSPPEVVIGISVEPAASVASRMQDLSAAKPDAAGALVPAAGPAAGTTDTTGNGAQPSTLVLAQRIIQNAFNFLASFSGSAGQVEVVPLKAFEEWWKKFESRIRSDPSFLERVSE